MTKAKQYLIDHAKSDDLGQADTVTLEEAHKAAQIARLEAMINVLNALSEKGYDKMSEMVATGEKELEKLIE